VQHRMAVERFLQSADTKFAHENPMEKCGRMVSDSQR
jgi:hypothetical protein